MPRILIVSAAVCLMTAGLAVAQTAPSEPPPNGKKLSEIIAKVEQRPDFRYIGEVNWNDGYEVTYYTTDNAKVEIKFDPVSGQTKSLR